MFSDDSEEQQNDELKINEKFKDRFEHNEKRKELERLQAKYGNDPVDEDGSEYSSSSSEDDDARMLTDKAEHKFQ